MMQKTLREVTAGVKSVRPINKIRSWFFSIAEHKNFDSLITWAVSINMAVLCCEWYNSPKWYKDVLEHLNLTFVIIFAIEALIKLVGWGSTFYFSQVQNKFDFFLVVVSAFGILRGLIPLNITALRVIRGARILRIFKSLNELSELLGALYQSIKSFGYVMMLSGLILFVFGLMGMRIFSTIDEGHYDVLGEQANFQTFYITMTTLWRAATGEEWNMIMRETMYAKGKLAAIYWILFVLINVHIFLNIVVAVIFEKLEERARQNN